MGSGRKVHKPMVKACEFCHDKHLHCDTGRPCQNCLKRNNICKEKPRKSKRKGSESEAPMYNTDINFTQDTQPPFSLESQSENTGNEMNFTSNLLNQYGRSVSSELRQQQQQLEPKVSPQNTDESNNIEFDSAWANNEYLKLDELTKNGPQPNLGSYPNSLTEVFDESKGIEELPLSVKPTDPMRVDTALNLSQFLNLGKPLYKSQSRPYISLDMMTPGNGNDQTQYFESGLPPNLAMGFPPARNNSIISDTANNNFSTANSVETEYLPASKGSPMISNQSRSVQYQTPNIQYHTTTMDQQTSSATTIDENSYIKPDDTRQFPVQKDSPQQVSPNDRTVTPLAVPPIDKGNTQIPTDTEHPVKTGSHKRKRDSTSHRHHSDITPYRFRQLVKTPLELFEKQYLIKPHNYRYAYKKLLEQLERIFLKDSNTKRRGQLQAIVKCILEDYVPTFITLTSNMIDSDLYLQELTLQRTLLELESMAKLVNCSPICIWRRSGELCYVSEEFLQLTGFKKKELLAHRRFIFEFLDPTSIVNYFTNFHEYLAFGSKTQTTSNISLIKQGLLVNGQVKFTGNPIIAAGPTCGTNTDAIFDECHLLLNNGYYLKCASCWTVKRDSFNIPLLIMGQFLPVFENQ